MVPDYSNYLSQPKLGEADVAAATAAKVPVDDLYPQTSWVACLGDQSLPPTSGEFAVIRSYIEFRLSNEAHYGRTYAARILAAALPAVDGGHSTLVFIKCADGWRYRNSTWDQLWSRQAFPSLRDLIRSEVEPAVTADDGRVIRDRWGAWAAAHKSLLGA